MIGISCLIDRSIIPFIAALEIKSKWGVSPLITQPSAINALYFFMLAETIKGMRGVDGGKLFNAKVVESITALIININRVYKAHASIKITGIDGH